MLYRDSGALRFPILGSASFDTADLTGLDPARDIMLALFAAALVAELQGVWRPAVAHTPCRDAVTPVAQRVPFSPLLGDLRQMKVTMPALFVYRQPTSPIKHSNFTMWQRRFTTSWGIDYFLGPLDVGAQGRIQDVLVAAGKVFAEVVEDGGHSAYHDGANVLGSVGIGACGFSTVALTEFRAGGAQVADEKGPGPIYWAATGTIETTELVRPRDGEATDFLGAAFTLGSGTGEGLIPNIVEATTDEEP